MAVAIVAGLLSAGCSVFGIRTVEEPPYTVVRQAGPVEIRHYGDRVAAETEVGGDEIEARSTGFKRLAGYIFGGNAKKQSIDMTAPVSQSSAETIAMTAPVDQARTEGGAWRIRFFMPKTYTLQTLPQPNDPAVHLVAVPGETVAVLRYSGIPSAATVAAEERRLLAALPAAGAVPDGAPFTWFYDPPWTIPPLRRNEAVVKINS